jgi:predicted 3-demethylubiquinone-9 3-methyltransferase (glyoxalase superfamily)
MATSITTFLTYDTQAEEAAKLYASLFDGKIKETMRYPAGGQCGWLVDKFGVSWQIVPRQLGGMLSAKDKEKSSRAMQAMMGMQKLDLAKLQAAFDGE